MSERLHYSNKGSHWERSRHHNQVKDYAKRCAGECDNCIVVADCVRATIFEQKDISGTIFESTIKADDKQNSDNHTNTGQTRASGQTS